MFSITFRASENVNRKHFDWCIDQLDIFSEGNPLPDNQYMAWLFTKGNRLFLSSPPQQLEMLVELTDLMKQQVPVVFHSLFHDAFYFWKTVKKSGTIKKVSLLFKSSAINQLTSFISKNKRVGVNRDALSEKLEELGLLDFYLINGELNYSLLRKHFVADGPAAHRANPRMELDLACIGIDIEFKTFLYFCMDKFKYDKLIGSFDGWGAYEITKSTENTLCPYCNRNYTHTVFEGNEFKGRPELDHFLPKSIFPFFAVSLFNLIPVCHSCNHSKSDESVLDWGQGILDFSLLHPHIPEDNVEHITIFESVQPGDLTDYFMSNDSTMYQKIKLTDSALQNKKIKNSLALYKLARFQHPSPHMQGYYAKHSRDIERTLDLVKYYPQSAIESIANLIEDDTEQLQKELIKAIVSNYPEHHALGKLKQDLLTDIIDSWIIED